MAVQPPQRVVAHAPGRATILGDHTDHQRGLVMPFALTLGVTVAAVRKIRSEPLPAPSATPATSATDAPTASVVVPPPPPPPDTAAEDMDALGPNESEITVTCTPACEKVLVDGKYASQYPAPLRVTPGRHGIGVGKTGYGGQYKLVFLKAGERQTVTFTLGATKK